MLTSTNIPINTNNGPSYVVARMHEGKLFVVPVNEMYQMRPSLAHLDAADARKREIDKEVADEIAQMVGRRCKLDPARKHTRFQNLIVKRITVLST